MCTTNVYTYIYPDGRKETTRIPSLCSHARHGVACSKNVIFQHPTSYVSNAGESSSAPSMGSPFLPTSGGSFPPTPSYTPRSGTPNNYRSGDESDRSGYRSGSSSRSKGRSPTVYINGQQVSGLEFAPKHSRKGQRSERVVVTNGPPSPRTPPTGFTGAHTAPSSPSAPYIVDVNPRRASSSSRKPVIVDPYLHTTTTHRHHKHSRNISSSSHESSRRSHDEEEAAAAQHRRRERKQQAYEAAERLQAQRTQKVTDRIARANKEIHSRPAVPMPPPPPRRTNTVYADAHLADAMQGLAINGTSRSERRRQKEQQEEEEAMKQRLRNRMSLPRRATVSGDRRARVSFDDATY